MKNGYPQSCPHTTPNCRECIGFPLIYSDGPIWGIYAAAIMFRYMILYTKLQIIQSMINIFVVAFGTAP